MAESIAGYTRPIVLNATGGGDAPSGPTLLTTYDIPDVVTPPVHTENRKIISVTGQAVFAAALPADAEAYAQFCLWAHPDHEAWPGVDAYDPFKEGPGDSAFEGMLAPRTFCRRTFVLAVPATGQVQTITEQHMVRSRAERLLRPGWKLTAGLYLRANTGARCTWAGILRTVVAG